MKWKKSEDGKLLARVRYCIHPPERHNGKYIATESSTVKVRHYYLYKRESKVHYIASLNSKQQNS